MFKKILIGTDGSDNAMRAAEAGRDIAKSMDAEVTLVYAAYVPPFYKGDLGSELCDVLREEGIRILDATARVFEGSGVRVATKLLYDEKSEEGILRLLEEGDYDLVIVGSRGLDATSRKALGSTSNRVLEGTDRPVLIVH
jgi:nucleotide-binding universal stress UspA family protein